MNVGIIVVRKRWNNAPSFLVEGLKAGLQAARKEDGDLPHKFVFTRFTTHTQRGQLTISPDDVSMFDVLVIPFWIGPYLLNCNLAGLKASTGVKIVTYTGRSLFYNDAFDYRSSPTEVKQGSLTDEQWRNFEAIDKFLVVKKMSMHPNETEIGCGQFDDFFNDGHDGKGAVIDFCKSGWDEPIWEALHNGYGALRSRFPQMPFIQLGKGPVTFEGAGVWNDHFCPYRRMCSLYSSIRLFFAMNESFGYPILENQYAGTPVLMHEDADSPSFHTKSRHIITWNSKNLVDAVDEALDQSKHGREMVREDFSAAFPELVSWAGAARRMIDAITKL